MAARSRAQAAACPCGSGVAYSHCCRPYHLGSAEAPTAETLMRSRYSAYVKRLPAYLRRTWHPETCPADLSLDRSPRWEDLTVIRVEGGGVDDDTGIVEFVARHDSGSMQETSTFVRLSAEDHRRWVYLGEPTVA